MRIKEQETCLTLQEHDVDGDDDDDDIYIYIYLSCHLNHSNNAELHNSAFLHLSE